MRRGTSDPPAGGRRRTCAQRSSWQVWAAQTVDRGWRCRCRWERRADEQKAAAEQALDRLAGVGGAGALQLVLHMDEAPIVLCDATVSFASAAANQRSGTPPSTPPTGANVSQTSAAVLHHTQSHVAMNTSAVTSVHVSAPITIAVTTGDTSSVRPTRAWSTWHGRVAAARLRSLPAVGDPPPLVPRGCVVGVILRWPNWANVQRIRAPGSCCYFVVRG